MPKLFPSYYAGECPEDIYQKYFALKNAPLTTKAPIVVAEKPFYTKLISVLISPEFILPANVIAVLLFLFILFLNQRKYNKSHALNLFCWFYIGIQLCLCSISIFNQSYKILWKSIWNANIFCQVDDSYNPPKIARYSGVTFPRWYFAFDTLRNLLERSFFFYILPLLLGFHRMNIYFACSHPLIYKKYLKESMLKYYYLFFGFFGVGVLMVRLFRADILTISVSASYAFDAAFAFIQIISCTFHVTITLLAVQVMLKYRKAQSNATLELQGFFYFSILPMILSIISMSVNTVYVIVSLMIVNNDNPKNVNSLYALFSLPDTVAAINDQLIVVLNPIFASLLMLLCIPNYQKAFKRIVLRQKGNESTVVKTQNTVSGSSKISTSSKRVVTHR